MAANEIVNSQQTEPVVNRWLVDYYVFLAFDLFEKEQYDDFRDARDVLDRIMIRPLEATDVLPTKILLLQFLSRLNEGENLDLSFEPDHSISPLESALIVLEKINLQCSIPLQDFQNVCSSLKEMIVVIYIKNNKFDKAEEVLNEHFPKPMVDKKAIFMALIRQKSKTHKVIEQINFQRFKKEMLTFCQSLYTFSVPFLHNAAKKLIDIKLVEPDNEVACPDGEDLPDPSTSQQIDIVPFVPCKNTIIQRTRLEVAYKALAAGSDERTFAQLEKEVEKETQAQKNLFLRLSPSPVNVNDRDSEQDGLFQRHSGSPMEASPADQPPQMDAAPQAQAGSLSKISSGQRKRQLYSVARLVIELDSQCSSQCTTAPQELEAEVRAEEQPQSAATPSKDQQNPVPDNEVTLPTRKRPRRAKSTCSSDGERNPPGSMANGETSHNQSISSVSRDSSKSNQSSSNIEDDPQESPAPCKTPLRKQLSGKDPGDKGDVCIVDKCLSDSSPDLSPHHSSPQTSSTPQRDPAQDRAPSKSKWKHLYENAKESKETWADEESYFMSKKTTASHNESIISNSGHRKKKWTEIETKKLKEGVEKFGEGNWGKIKSYYSFKDRTNVNLKDRWRTMKKLNMV